MKFLSNFFCAVVVLIIGLQMFTIPSFAQTYTGPQTDSGIPTNSHTLVQGLFLDIFSAISCQLIGEDPITTNHQCLGYNAQTGKLSYAPVGGGVIGFFSNSIMAMYTPPLHTSDYVHYISSNFGLVKKADAAGNTGFDQLSPLTNLWLAFRNLVYLLYVLIFIVIGFAIMLRLKIDPRTVMTIENQIPKIIVSLLLVTFSFAIAGLVVDFMWVMMYLVINLFASVDPNISAGAIVSNIRQNPLLILNSFDKNGGFGIWNFAYGAAGSVNTIIDSSVHAALMSVNDGVRAIIMGFLGIPLFFTSVLPCVPQVIIGNFGNCLKNNETAQIALLGSVVVFVVFLFALIFALFRIWFILLQGYVLFLLFAATGPLFIMGGAIPGSKINFEYWIRQMLAYMSAFVVAMGILLFGKVLVDSFGNSSAGFIPPFLGIQEITSSKTLASLIGLMVMLLVPQSLTMVRDLLGAPPIKYLPGIGQQLGSGLKFGGSVADHAFKRVFHERNIQTGQEEGWGTKLLLGTVDQSGTFQGGRLQQLLRGLAYGKWKGMK